MSSARYEVVEAEFNVPVEDESIFDLSIPAGYRVIDYTVEPPRSDFTQQEVPAASIPEMAEESARPATELDEASARHTGTEKFPDEETVAGQADSAAEKTRGGRGTLKALLAVIGIVILIILGWLLVKRPGISRRKA